MAPSYRGLADARLVREPDRHPLHRGIERGVIARRQHEGERAFFAGYRELRAWTRRDRQRPRVVGAGLLERADRLPGSRWRTAHLVPKLDEGMPLVGRECHR